MKEFEADGGFTRPGINGKPLGGGGTKSKQAQTYGLGSSSGSSLVATKEIRSLRSEPREEGQTRDFCKPLAGCWTRLDQFYNPTRRGATSDRPKTRSSPVRPLPRKRWTEETEAPVIESQISRLAIARTRGLRLHFRSATSPRRFFYIS